MTVSIEEAGNGIKDLIDDIADPYIRQIMAPTDLSNSPNAYPCVLIIPGNINYEQCHDALGLVSYRILVLASAPDTKTGIDRLLPLMELTGANSIYARLAADKTLNGKAKTSFIRSCSGVGYTDWNGTSYLSTEFNIDVMV